MGKKGAYAFRIEHRVGLGYLIEKGMINRIMEHPYLNDDRKKFCKYQPLYSCD
jgi:hypothetical protein